MPVQTHPARSYQDAEHARDEQLPVDKQELLDNLNYDLAGEYQAVLMYTQYSAKLTGPYREPLRAVFQAEIKDELGHAQFLADKVAALGGKPTAAPRPVPNAEQPREMVERILEAEKQTIAAYKQRIDEADAFGDTGLRVELENLVADETRHKEEMERLLAGWDQR